MDPNARHIDDPPGTDDREAYEEPLGGGAMPAYDPKADTPPRKEWKDEQEEG